MKTDQIEAVRNRAIRSHAAGTIRDDQRDLILSRLSDADTADAEGRDRVRDTDLYGAETYLSSIGG